MRASVDGPNEGSNIEVIDYAGTPPGDELLIHGQKLNGRWFAHAAFGIDTSGKVENTDSQPWGLPTNWPELRGKIGERKVNFAEMCPKPRMTVAEFEEWAKPVVPNYHDRPHCDPNPKPVVEECTEANGCLPDDGDDTN
ncbi:MAG: hypothetical protein R3E66_23790 [bacterium]